MVFNFPASWGPFPGAQFPYTQTGALNMDWVIWMVKQLSIQIEQFVALNTVKYANPFQWDITSQYERNTVVIDPASNIAYISTQPVPNGIAITNTDYWAPVFDLSQAVLTLSYASYNQDSHRIEFGWKTNNDVTVEGERHIYTPDTCTITIVGR